MKERIKQTALYLNGRFLSDTHNQPEPEFEVYCTEKDIKYYANTPNTIIYFNCNGVSGFFRECRMHEEKHQYLKRLIAEYCRYVYRNEYSQECERILLEKLSVESNFKKFFNMGAGTANYTNITKFRRTLNSDHIGLPEPYPMWFKNQLLQLVQFAWGALEEYKYNSFLNPGQYHTYNANRTIVTKKIMDMLGVEDIIPETKYMRLVLDGQPRVGVFVGKAPGASPIDEKNQGIFGVTPNFQRQTICLNLADVICYQKDHRPGNYFITLDSNRRAHNLCAFDNDCPTTLLPTPNICFYSYSGYSPFVNKEGMVNRPFLDKTSVDRLLAVTEKDLEMLLNGDVSKVQYKMLWKRVRRLQDAVKKSLKEKNTRVITESEWSMKTIESEISGAYGQTYLKYFIDNYTKGEY